MNGQETGHQRGLLLAGLLTSSTAYALLLNTRTGRKWAGQQTWATVVAGVMLVTAWIAAEDRRSGWLSMIYFFVAGIPIIIRSLWLQLEALERAAARLVDRP